MQQAVLSCSPFSFLYYYRNRTRSSVLCYLLPLLQNSQVSTTLSAMGLSGTIDYFSDLFGSSHKHKKKKQIQTVELKVRMDCEGCELKVKKVLSSMKGVRSVDINLKQQRVTVTGYVEPNKVLKKAQSTGKKAELWPYVPYSLVSQPYTVQAYDKRAPPGYVRNVETITVTAQGSRQEEHITNMFSDENPNSCSVM